MDLRKQALWEADKAVETAQAELTSAYHNRAATVYQAYCQGLTVTEIADVLDVTRAMIYNHLKDHKKRTKENQK